MNETALWIMIIKYMCDTWIFFIWIFNGYVLKIYNWLYVGRLLW